MILIALAGAEPWISHDGGADYDNPLLRRGGDVSTAGDYCCEPDSGDCCGPGSWCCARAGEHAHDDDNERSRP